MVKFSFNIGGIQEPIVVFTNNKPNMAFLLGVFFGTSIDSPLIIGNMMDAGKDELVDVPNPHFENAYIVELED